MIHGLKSQLLTELKSLIKSYPNFVLKNNVNPEGIPVFVFHSIEPNLFESQLMFLKENNYNTISIEDYYDFINGKKVDYQKCVLLTVDDARLSFWKYAYPLLKKYEMKATLFIIPGVTLNGEKRKNLEHVWEQRIGLDELDKIDPYDTELCNWDEIVDLHKSGLINVENHTLFHKEVFISKKIVDFIGSETVSFKYNSEISPYFDINMVNKPFNKSNFLGLPIFEKIPLLECYNNFKPNQKIIDYCREYFENNSTNKNWKEQLIKEINSIGLLDDSNFTIIDGKESVKQDLILARKILQSKLDENVGNHLCLPWTRGNTETIEVCKEIGIKTVFWGVLDNKKTNKPKDDPYYNTRIKNDFIFCLPGKGRKPLHSIYLYKIKRRLSGEKVF